MPNFSHSSPLPTASVPNHSFTLLRTLGWGLFLACSWTWCIGMFLPVMLIRDMGWPGFLAFAIPNITGAALFGVVLAAKGASESFVASHRTVIWAFSVVTIAFQAFFVGALLHPTPLSWEQVGILALAACVAAAVRKLSTNSTQLLWLSLATWVCSVVLMVLATTSGAVGPPAEITRHPPEILPAFGLGAVCVLGFLFCPYLDATFHQARQSLPGRPGTLAFILGFCIFFATMITFTVVYAREGTLAAIPIGDDTNPMPLAFAFSKVVLVHLAVQLGFTTGAHLPHAVSQAPGPAESPQRRLWLIGPIGVGLLISLLSVGKDGVHGLSGFEIVYRLFLTFFGLIFPAYIWICALPLHATAKPGRDALVTCLIAIALASPFYWVGFMQRDYAWLIPGVIIVLLARVVGKQVLRFRGATA